MSLEASSQPLLLALTLTVSWKASSILQNSEIAHMKNLTLKCSIRPGELQKYSHLHLKMEKAMAPHSSTLAWKIPWMKEPGGLQSMGSLRVRYD